MKSQAAPAPTWGEIFNGHLEKGMQHADAADRADRAIERRERELTHQINSAPEPLRSYIRDLATRADPAGDLLRIQELQETVMILEAALRDSSA